MKLKLPDSSKNWISLVGATIALITFSMIVFLFIITSVTHSGNTYLGLIIYVLLPGVLFIGLLLIPIGMWLKTRRDRRRTEEERKGWPVINFNRIRRILRKDLSLRYAAGVYRVSRLSARTRKVC